MIYLIIDNIIHIAGNSEENNKRQQLFVFLNTLPEAERACVKVISGLIQEVINENL